LILENRATKNHDTYAEYARGEKKRTHANQHTYTSPSTAYVQQTLNSKKWILTELSEDDQQYVHFSICYSKPIAVRNSNGRMSREFNASSRKLKENNNEKQHRQCFISVSSSWNRLVWWCRWYLTACWGKNRVRSVYRNGSV
jgi:hypothetical protein